MGPVVVLPQVSPQPSHLLLADQEVPRCLPRSDAQVLQVSSSAARQHQEAHTAKRCVRVWRASLCGLKEQSTLKHFYTVKNTSTDMMYLTFLGLFYCLVVYFSQQVFRQKIALHSLKAMGFVGVDVWLRVPVRK